MPPLAEMRESFSLFDRVFIAVIDKEPVAFCLKKQTGVVLSAAGWQIKHVAPIAVVAVRNYR